jgi:transposase
LQAAWAASHTKNSYLASQYPRLRGKKRALIAVGHSILVILYYLLKERSQYADLGADFLDRLEPKRLTRYYVKRLKHLAHSVKLEPCVSA